jgi:transcriptional repressor NrdR
MVCPHCNQGTHVLESRRAEDGLALRRRRECTSCGHRFTTFERAEPEPLHVRKRNGHRQRFDRTKLRAALLNATHKRPVSPRDIEAAVGRIEARIAAGGGESSSDQVALHCLEELRELDHGAYLQFAGTLPEPNAQFAEVEDSSARAGSVRLESNHGQSTPKAAPRRGLDG